MTQDRQAAAEFGLQLVTVRAGRHEILADEPGVLGGFGNSGMQLLNLAVQWGATRLVLVGFDLNATQGVHWHGPHAARLNNPSDARLAQWAERLDRQAHRLSALGVEVLNTSPTSALRAFRKLTLQEALGA